MKIRLKSEEYLKKHHYYDKENDCYYFNENADTIFFISRLMIDCFGNSFVNAKEDSLFPVYYYEHGDFRFTLELWMLDIINDVKPLKNDSGKLDYTLLPFIELQEVVEVLQFGAEKYSRDNWKTIEKERYVKAMFRHLVDYLHDETDTESGKSHLAHLICNALFVMYFDNERSENETDNICRNH